MCCGATSLHRTISLMSITSWSLTTRHFMTYSSNFLITFTCMENNLHTNVWGGEDYREVLQQQLWVDEDDAAYTWHLQQQQAEASGELDEEVLRENWPPLQSTSQQWQFIESIVATVDFHLSVSYQSRHNAIIRVALQDLGSHHLFLFTLTLNLFRWRQWNKGGFTRLRETFSPLKLEEFKYSQVIECWCDLIE